MVRHGTRCAGHQSYRATLTRSPLADVFGSGDRLEDVAARWVARFNEHEAKAVAEVINLVLRASGCNLRIDEDDIADPDNAPSRVAELQDEYQAQDVTDYPLIAKAKDGGGHAFGSALRRFFFTIVQSIAQSGLMYENQELLENIAVWIGAMSSSANRPFRHTATVAALAITTALAEVAAELNENKAKKMRQGESEAKKSRVNKARVSAANQEVEDFNAKLEYVDGALNHWFSLVYVHRYRDVDPHIRHDCVGALADWIITHPDKFFDGSHLRYLGWVLSDPHSPTRVEVLEQMARLFTDKDKLAGLKTFTERFRPRIVEIATRDAENNVRAAAVDLLDILREAGFLEPDDIDSVGKLIFDADTKVRKSVVGFFAENVNAAYEAIVDDMGGQEALDEALGSPDDEEEGYQNPRLEWLKLKCLVDQLLSYDEDDEELPTQIERISHTSAQLGLVTAGVESRYSLAAQALYDAVPEIRSWEVLAGYLLYDHTQTGQSGGDDAEAMLQQNCKLEEKHETVLLDVLNAVVRLRLQRLAEAQTDRKKTKAQRESDQEEQAEMARRLTLLIPDLLKKFGALPEAAALCLRLERELSLDVFEELRQNTALTALLDDINKQFLTHHNERVLVEAVGSMLHAQENEELKEVIHLKFQALWDDLINTFDALRGGKDFSARGNLEQNILVGVSNIVLKIAQLSKVSDAAILDEMVAPAKSRSKSKKAAPSSPPIVSILQILDRGLPSDDLDAEMNNAEDTLVCHAMSALFTYFIWKCKECMDHIEAGTSMPEDDLTVLVDRRDTCITSLMLIIEHRKGADDVRLEAANLLIDVYNMYRSLKAKKENLTRSTPKKVQGRVSSANEDETSDDWESLVQEVDTHTIKHLLHTLSAMENNLAKLANKRLEEPDVDDDPVDPDDEPESDEEEENTRSYEDKQVRLLIAEERLCQYGGRLVQACLVGSLGKEGGEVVKKRLERNKTKLTATWKEVVSHLDTQKFVKKAKKGAAKPAAKAGKSKEVVVESDDEAENEVPGDEIEDEEMADVDAEHDEGQANGVDDGEEERSPEREGDEESILGD
jgi:cohesin complex subunit SA-1/2